MVFNVWLERDGIGHSTEVKSTLLFWVRSNVGFLAYCSALRTLLFTSKGVMSEKTDAVNSLFICLVECLVQVTCDKIMDNVHARA